MVLPPAEVSVESLQDVSFAAAVDGHTWRLGQRYLPPGVTWAVECGTCGRMRFDHPTRAAARAWLTKHRADVHALDRAPAPVVQMPGRSDQPANVRASSISPSETPRSRRAS